MAGLAEGDHAHVQRAVDFARGQAPDPLIALCQFLGEAVKDERAAAMAYLTPEVEAVLWNDFQYTECVAEGFAVLGDVPNMLKWLGRSVDLGMSYIAPFVESHMVWFRAACSRARRAASSAAARRAAAWRAASSRAAAARRAASSASTRRAAA